MPTVEVIPFVPLSSGSRRFAYTYRVPAKESVAPGTLVRIPFGKRTVSGIVFREATQRIPPWKLKTIASVTSSVPLFTPAELAMLQHLAELSLESFPLLVQSAARVRSVGQADDISENLKQKARRRASRIDVRWKPLTDLLPSALHGQLLLLIPETSVAHATIELLEKKKLPWAFFAQTLPVRERRALLQRLRTGESLVIVATHPGIFLPLPALSRIIVVEAALPAHRQWDLHPRYDARIGALLRGKAQGVPVTFQSTLPSLDLARLSPPEPNDILRPGSVRVLPRMSTDPLFSPVFLSAIRDTIERGGHVFIFHNIVGTERAFVCGTCGALLTCPECGGILERVRSQLHCRQCKAARGPLLRFCPRCNSPHLSPRRIGTSAIVDMLRHIVPGVSVAQADRDTLPRLRAGTLSARAPAPHSILVGTERAFAALGEYDLFDCIIVLDADRFLESLSFDAAERAMITITRLAHRRRADAPLLLATTHPHQTLFRALETDLRIWMEEELADRRTLQYPPEAVLIRLERTASSAGQARTLAKKLLQRLAASAPDVRTGFRVIERPRPRAEILLRGPRAALSDALRFIPTGWNTDPFVPVSLLASSLP